MNENIMFTSRSAVESFLSCPRYRYNQTMLEGKGVVAIKKSVPLVSGGAIHIGVGHMMNCLKLGNPVNVEKAVELGLMHYDNEVEEAGFRATEIRTDYQQWYTYQEQRCLVEGLIRCWHIVELPKIQEKYDVLGVEREIEPIEIVPGVMFQARADAEMRVKETGDLHGYSLKTMKQWGEREESSYKGDLQGITETWAIEQDNKRIHDRWLELRDMLSTLMGTGDNYNIGNITNIGNMFTYMVKKQPKLERVMGVRFCFLIKGIRKRTEYGSTDSEKLYVTYSPLVRGYKRITPSSIEYAHSWFYPNPENKTGKSAIGKGWEPFNVWEMEGGVKEWIEKIKDCKIQPECGDIIKQQVITPMEYFRDEEEITEAIREVAAQESRIRDSWLQMQQGGEEIKQYHLDTTFPHNRDHCQFHYGQPCEYRELCWSMEVKSNPLGSGLYSIRVPHHESEREG